MKEIDIKDFPSCFFEDYEIYRDYYHYDNYIFKNKITGKVLFIEEYDVIDSIYPKVEARESIDDNELKTFLEALRKNENITSKLLLRFRKVIFKNLDGLVIGGIHNELIDKIENNGQDNN